MTPLRRLRLRIAGLETRLGLLTRSTRNAFEGLQDVAKEGR
jgi:hypothetical protein